MTKKPFSLFLLFVFPSFIVFANEILAGNLNRPLPLRG